MTNQANNVPIHPSSLICTWDNQSDCAHCGNDGKLNCKWDKHLLNGFLVVTIPYMIVGFFGMMLTGQITGVWWPFILLVVFFPVFFLGIEIRVLCCHCPYYAEDSSILHCLANHGIPKLWPYHPEPLNSAEKIILLIGFFFFFGGPFLFQTYGIWFVITQNGVYSLITVFGLSSITGATFFSAMVMFARILRHYCPKCVNFSCPLNRVPKALVDAYLERNSVMKSAWEEAGYKLG